MVWTHRSYALVFFLSGDYSSVKVQILLHIFLQIVLFCTYQHYAFQATELHLLHSLINISFLFQIPFSSSSEDILLLSLYSLNLCSSNKIFIFLSMLSLV